MLLDQLPENTINSVEILLKELDIKYTRLAVKEQLENHPNYPSLLSISDILNEWGVDNLSIKIDAEKLCEVDLPFIAVVRVEDLNYFTVVKINGEIDVTLSDYFRKKWKKISREDFLRKWTGVVMLVESSDKSEEKNYQANKKREIKQRQLFWFAHLILASIGISSTITNFHSGKILPLFTISFILLKLIGLYICLLLLWYEIDEHNPFLQNICLGGKNFNCNSILKSKASKLFYLGWNEIGFIYFAGGLATLLFGNNSLMDVFFLAWLNLLAVPFVVYSVYYQWRIAKQWCKLCIAVQIVLSIEFILFFVGQFYSKHVEFIDLNASTFRMVGCFLLPGVAWAYFKPLLLSNKINTEQIQLLSKLKYNYENFKSILINQKKLQHQNQTLGIVFGEDNAKYKIIKFCNPFCGPCAKAHFLLDQIYELGNVQLQIIFVVDPNDKENPITKTAQYLMAINSNEHSEFIRKVLDDWYSLKTKSYEIISENYKVKIDDYTSIDSLKLMKDWSLKETIKATPTIFVNGFQLPSFYSLEDLKYFIRNDS